VHPKWGPKRLVFEMDRRGHGIVTGSTVYRVLVRNGLIEPKSRKRRRQDYKRWERPVAMQLWQLDVTANAFLTDGREVKIITGIDDHSRYCVIARAVMRATARPVCQAFLDAVSTYGVPEEVLSDNGTVFTGRFIKPRPAEVLFERICRENGITQRLTRPASPTTTGKIERLHQSLQNELLNDHGPFESVEALQAALDAWRQDYNTDRPHQSLGMAFPASRFAPAVSEPELRVPARQGLSPAPETDSAPSATAAPAQAAIEAAGWCRHPGTCRSAGSRSGSDRHWQAVRSPSGPMRPSCMSCWTASGSKLCPPGWARSSWPAWPPTAPGRPGRRRCGPGPAPPSRSSAWSTAPASSAWRAGSSTSATSSPASASRCGWTAPR
jgi:transposase InsO family protein